jgi:hypothetical protein
MPTAGEVLINIVPDRVQFVLGDPLLELHDPVSHDPIGGHHDHQDPPVGQGDELDLVQGQALAGDRDGDADAVGHLRQQMAGTFDAVRQGLAIPQLAAERFQIRFE